MLLTVTSAITLSGVMLAICIVAHAVDNRLGRFVAAASFEIAFVCGLFALWQVANGVTRGHTSAGVARGRAVYHFERVLHLPSERSAQHLILGHREIVRAANYYYDTAHLTLMVVFLIWLWLVHRERYPFIRNMLVVFTGMSLLIQIVAVAPPRLIGGTGLVDTEALYHQSVYGNAAASAIADQYAAMPSIHVGWAMLISFAIVTVNKSRWRWIGLVYGPTTFFVVVATANHYWLDGAAAIGLLVVAWAAAKGIERLQQRRPALVAVSDAVPPSQIQQGAFS